MGQDSNESASLPPRPETEIEAADEGVSATGTSTRPRWTYPTSRASLMTTRRGGGTSEVGWCSPGGRAKRNWTRLCRPTPTATAPAAAAAAGVPARLPLPPPPPAGWTTCSVPTSPSRSAQPPPPPPPQPPLISVSYGAACSAAHSSSRSHRSTSSPAVDGAGRAVWAAAEAWWAGLR